MINLSWTKPDTAGTADSYEFFGGVLSSVSKLDEAVTALSGVTFAFSKDGVSEAKITVTKFDQKNGDKTIEITENKTAGDDNFGFKGNTLKFYKDTDSTYGVSIDLTTIMQST